MKNHLSLLLVSVVFASFAHGKVVCGEGKCTVNTGTVMDKELAKVSEGTRIKKVLFVKAKVYRADLYLSKNAKWKKGDADILSKLDDSLPILLQLNLLRTVDAKKIEESFRDGLKANKVDVNSGGYAEFLGAVLASGEIKEGQSVSIIGSKKLTGEEVITWVSTDRKETGLNVPAGTIKGLFSIWFGTPADDELGKLKNELLGL